MRLPAYELRRRLFIIFRGEDGLDYGGVARWGHALFFFSSTCVLIFYFFMFILMGKDKTVWQFAVVLNVALWNFRSKNSFCLAENGSSSCLMKSWTLCTACLNMPTKTTTPSKSTQHQKWTLTIWCISNSLDASLQWYAFWFVKVIMIKLLLRYYNITSSFDRMTREVMKENWGGIYLWSS